MRSRILPIAVIGLLLACGMTVSSDFSNAASITIDPTTLSANQTYQYPAGTVITIDCPTYEDEDWHAVPSTFTVSTTATGVNIYATNPENDDIVYDILVYFVAPSTATVTFNSNGGSSVPSQSVTLGGCATQPANPTNGIKVFSGWYTDQACTQVYNFSTPVNSDITLYAKWTDPSVQITSVQYNVSMKAGSLYSYDVVTTPSDAAISVSGPSWMTVSGHSIRGTPTSPGTYNVTVTATASGYVSATQSFTVTVSSQLAPTNSPANGAIAYVW